MSDLFELMNRMIRYLQEKPRSVGEISNYLNKNKRTVFRHLAALKKHGYALQTSGNRGNTVYYLSKEEDQTPALMLRKVEKMQQELLAGGNHKYSTLLESMIHYLDPSRDKKRVREFLRIDPGCYISHGPLAEHKEYRNMVSKVLQAIEDFKVLRIQYGEERPANFFPLRVSLRVGRLYLLGVWQTKSDKSGDVKQLAFSRIQNFSVTSKTFSEQDTGGVNPKEFDPEKHYRYCFGQWVPAQQKPEEIRIEIMESWVKKLFQEADFNPPAKLTEQDGNAVATLKLYLTPDLENWLLGMHPDIRVREPQSLVRRLNKRMRDSLKR